MRHLGSLIAGLVVAPAAWVLLAYGQGHTYQNWNDTPPHNYFWYEPVLFLVAAGLLLGLLASTRISPVGPVLAGAIYLIAGVAARTVEDVYRLIPEGFTTTAGGVDRVFALRLPVDNGTTVLLGSALLVAALSVGRWRTRPNRVPVPVPSSAPEAGPSTAAVSDGTPAYGAPHWPAPISGWTVTEPRRSTDDNPPPLAKEPSQSGGSPWAAPPTQGSKG